MLILTRSKPNVVFMKFIELLFMTFLLFPKLFDWQGCTYCSQWTYSKQLWINYCIQNPREVWSRSCLGALHLAGGHSWEPYSRLFWLSFWRVSSLEYFCKRAIRSHFQTSHFHQTHSLVRFFGSLCPIASRLRCRDLLRTLCMVRARSPGVALV